MTNQEFYKISLPKWPECRVDGESVTKEQAQEILIRTQDFHISTNDRSFVIECYRALGLKIKQEYPYHDWNEIDQKREEYKCLDIEYLQNARIASSYIGGPNGWLNWDGTIYQTGMNIGKWPSIQAIHDEWKQIAKSFPYLDLQCQLFSGEGCEAGTVPVVEFVVKNGKASMKKPTEELLPQHPKTKEHNFNQMIQNRFLSPLSERGVTIEAFREALEQTKKSLTQAQF